MPTLCKYMLLHRGMVASPCDSSRVAALVWQLSATAPSHPVPSSFPFSKLLLGAGKALARVPMPRGGWQSPRGGWQCPGNRWPCPRGGSQRPGDGWQCPGVGGNAPRIYPRRSPLPGGAELPTPDRCCRSCARPRPGALPGAPLGPSAAAVSPPRPQRTSCPGKKGSGWSVSAAIGRKFPGRVSCLGVRFSPSPFSSAPLRLLPQGMESLRCSLRAPFPRWDCFSVLVFSYGKGRWFA